MTENDMKQLAEHVHAGKLTIECALAMVHDEPRLPWREREKARELTTWDLRHDGPVHAAFGLTYASHFVVPRLVLQSMPVAWQEDWCALMKDLHHELGSEWEPDGGYSIQAKKLNGKYAENPMSDYRHGKMIRPKCYDERPAA